MRYFIYLLLSTLLIGCVFFSSWERSMRSWVGAPVSEFAELNGNPDKTWVREDGKTVYKYHLEKIDPSCIHYWVVDDRGVIVDFYYEGYCRPVG